MREPNRRRALLGAALLIALTAVAVVWQRLHAGQHASAKRAALLELTLAAPDGRPAAAAAIVLTRGAHVERKQADARGGARFGPMNAGAAELDVSSRGAARLHRRLELKPGDNRMRLSLAAAVQLAGVVVDDVGAEIGGAALELQPESGDAPARVARGDAQGRFVFGELAAGSYALRARAEHHELAVIPALQAPAGEPLRIVLQRTATLRGEVLDASGQPAAGASVTIAGSGVWPPKELQSDAQGRFALSPVPGGVYELRARRGTWISTPQEGVVVEPAAEAVVRLQLQPGATLRGRVFDARSGTPLAKVAVTVIEDALSGTPLSAHTAEAGEFAFEGLRPTPHRVWIEAPGYVAIAGQPREPSAEPQAFPLRLAAVLSGTVVDERGAAVPEVELEVTGTTETGEPAHVSPPVPAGSASRPALAPPPAGDNLGVVYGVVPKIPLFSAPSDGAAPTSLQPGFSTDAQGRFRIEGVPGGRIQLVARRAGFAPSRSDPLAVEGGKPIEGVRIVLQRGATLLGRVVDAAGLPVASVLVQLEVEGDPAMRATLSAEDGSFRFDALRGSCIVTGRPAGEPEVRERIELDSGEQRQLVLQLAGESRELRGRVVDARGFPIASATIRVEALSARSPVSRSGVSAADGTFRVGGLPAPPYAVEADHPDYATTQLGPVSPEPQSELSVQLRQGARLSGLVLDRMRNEGIAGAHVRMRRGKDARTATTDAQGRFEFRNISIGKYDVFADKLGYVPGRAAVTLTHAEPRELDPIVLGPAGSVSGDVVDRLGSPVFDAEIGIGSPPQWRAGSRTDHRGHFQLTGIEPGDHTVSARHPQAGQSAQPVPVRVYALQESPGLVLRLPGQAAAGGP